MVGRVRGGVFGTAQPGRKCFFERNGMSPAGVHSQSPYPFVGYSDGTAGMNTYTLQSAPRLWGRRPKCAHMHAHLGARVKWMDGTHTSPNSTPSCQLPPPANPNYQPPAQFKSLNQKFRIKGYELNVQT